MPLSKFDMFTFVVSFTICFIVFFLNWCRKQDISKRRLRDEPSLNKTMAESFV